VLRLAALLRRWPLISVVVLDDLVHGVILAPLDQTGLGVARLGRDPGAPVVAVIVDEESTSAFGSQACLYRGRRASSGTEAPNAVAARYRGCRSSL
jgi:hypothetical protein